MNESNRSKSWPNRAGPIATLSLGALVVALVVLVDGQPAPQRAGGAGAVTSRVASGPAAAEGEGERDTSVPAADEALRSRGVRDGTSPEEMAPTF